eukprot:SAG31_NODE_7616_length_1640_cov_0.801428_2_plen_272_part_00
MLGPGVTWCYRVMENLDEHHETRRLQTLHFLQQLARSPLSADPDGAKARESLLRYHTAVFEWNDDQLQRQIHARQHNRGNRARAARSSNRDVRRPARYLQHWTLGAPCDGQNGRREHYGNGGDDITSSIRIGRDYQASVPGADIPATSSFNREVLTEREVDLCGRVLSSRQSCADRAQWPMADCHQLEHALYMVGKKDFSKAKLDGMDHLTTADVVDYFYNHWKSSPGHAKFLRWQKQGAKPAISSGVSSRHRRPGGRQVTARRREPASFE